MESGQDYKKILTELIQKQMALLGSQIALQRARSVQGLMIMDDGSVASFAGDPKAIMQNVIDQFVQLSGLIVKKTMEPFVEDYQKMPTATKGATI
jgi:hypothetical protein